MTPLPLPSAGNLVVHASVWEDGERPNERVRVLIDDPSGYRTKLISFGPGPIIERHAHDVIEQIYVLEGDFFDDEGSYGPGDFVLRMPGTMHGAGSRSGGLMLIVYTPAPPAAPASAA